MLVHTSVNLYERKPKLPFFIITTLIQCFVIFLAVFLVSSVTSVMHRSKNRSKNVTMLLSWPNLHLRWNTLSQVVFIWCKRFFFLNYCQFRFVSPESLSFDFYWNKNYWEDTRINFINSSEKRLKTLGLFPASHSHEKGKKIDFTENTSCKTRADKAVESSWFAIRIKK